MVFIIGELRPFRPSEVKHVASFEDMKDIVYGDIVETFGHVVEWDHDCVPVELCESWRLMGDPVCDGALREVFTSPTASVGQDLLQAVQSHAAATSHEEAPATHAFLDEVFRRPPPGIAATEEEVTLARQLFIDDSVQIMQAMLYFSLAGGLARYACQKTQKSHTGSSRIVRTLEAVSYLRAPASLAEVASQIPKESNERTFMRLVETMQFVLDVMGCSISGPHSTSGSQLSSLLPEGEGWKSAVRVRLLHGVARWRVQARWEREHPTEMLDSVPMSQEEVAATLGAFSTIPIWCLDRLHLPPPPDKASAYLALWRHVGYYMGVAPSILQRHFSSTRAADKFVATAALNLFLEDVPSTPPSLSTPIIKGPTVPILVAVSNRPPLHASFEYNIALTTHLVGAPLARRLGLPPTPLATRLKMHAFLLAQRVPHYFAAWYPRTAWLAKRRAVLAEGMMRSVRGSMGMRRSAFRPRTELHSTQTGGPGGELAPGRDPARAQVLTRQWSEVLLELVGVSVGAGILASVVAYWSVRSALSIALAILLRIFLHDYPGHTPPNTSASVGPPQTWRGLHWSVSWPPAPGAWRHVRVDAYDIRTEPAPQPRYVFWGARTTTADANANWDGHGGAAKLEPGALTREERKRVERMAWEVEVMYPNASGTGNSCQNWVRALL
ncbi:hypothetical protein LXA43DRAFT_974282 [Ganoderma leucocontextum]|nr:hypothetical protein LXA43DRAFT_974282 [Ganoderma leucocontextum]